jgi:hypothetical protein
MAEDEIIKHAKAVYETMNDKQKNWKHKLKEILIEILIIVFAVSISIWFHNWAESFKDKKEEKEFLSGLKDDLEADIKEMKSDSAGLRKAQQGIYYFQRVGAGDSLYEDSIKKYNFIFFSWTQISPRISRFEAIKGSGKLDIIENKKLLYNLIDLYQKDFPQITKLNDEMNSLTNNKILPFLEDHVVSNAKDSLLLTKVFFRIPKMRVLLSEGNAVQNNIAAYSEGIYKSNEILNQIDEELK